MKKSNLITVVVLSITIIAILLFVHLKESKNNITDYNSSSYSTNSETVSDTISENPSSFENVSSVESDTLNTTYSVMTDALFIGDSRTVGIMEYSKINDADFFCHTGMNVYNVCKQRISVKNIGKVTLTELLQNKKYGKVYIMLGINELGYNLQSTLKKYNELIKLIENNQSDAVIFIQANLHVTKSRSDSDNIINNSAINAFNKEISKLADNKNKFYLYANILFDDENCNLSDDKTQDNVHLYAKYYAEWGEWIRSETAKYIKEGWAWYQRTNFADK